MPSLRCPATGSGLSLSGEGSLVAADDGRRYPIVGGVPILLVAEKSLFEPTNVEGWSRPIGASGPGARRLREAARWLVALPPTASRSVGTRENYAQLRSLLHERIASSGTPARVLVVGGGSTGVGAEAVIADPAFELVETDVYIGPRTLIVCDGHDLPFADGSFDAVICQAVLEHVVDPSRVASEIWRVLRPTGLVYSEVPFMQQVHLGAFDFTRFTQLGHRRLWRYFDEVAAGAQGGPGMALIWSIGYFLRAFLPRRLWALADRVASLCFFWLKYFDGYLVQRPGGLDAASGTYFLGRRRLTPLADRAIVAGYRGGGPRLKP